jgi:hypothetical protein
MIMTQYYGRNSMDASETAKTQWPTSAQSEVFMQATEVSARAASTPEAG